MLKIIYNVNIKNTKQLSSLYRKCNQQLECYSIAKINRNNFSIFTRNINTATTKIKKPNLKLNSSNKVTPFSYFLLLIPVTTFGLGVWQIQRKKWKESLIQNLEVHLKRTPIDCPADILELQSMEYCPVKVTGKFLHDKELYMGPRSLISSTEHQGGGLFTAPDASIGFLVITPFQLDGRNETILINRGWIPRSKVKPETRLEGQINKTVELVGIVRRGENRAQFQPENRGNMFHYRNILKMCSLTNADPIFLDATVESTIPGGPIGGQTRATIRNEHLSYIVTWFSLSAFTGFLWYQQVMKRKRF